MARFSPSVHRFLALPPSERRLGPFVLVEQLGRGGFAPVWLAREVYGDAELRTAAIKLFGIEGPAAARERVIAEAQALCRVEHPSVVRFYALPMDEARGVMGLAMEHVAGTPLHERIARGRLAVDEALSVGAAVASALAAVHKAGLVHRDVKPANVIEAAGVPKLIDFGIAAADTLAGSRTGPRRLGDLPESALGTRLSSLDTGMDPETTAPFAVACGTLGYIDPAIVGDGEPATAASDLYALGVLLYECLTGRLPAFDPESSQLRGEVLDGRARGPSLGKVAPGMPAELVELVDALLAPSRRERPPSAEAVARELLDLLDERAAPAPQIAARPPAPSRAAGRAGAVAVASVLVAAGGSAAYFAAVRGHETRDAAQPALPSASPLPPSAAPPAATQRTTAVPAVPLGRSFSLTVPPGRAPSGAWLPELTVQREPGDEGRPWLAAMDRCEARGLALCTETQWSRACAEDARLGAVETWTASADGDRGMGVRGGAGCDARRVAGLSEPSPSRAGICCSRAVAVRSSRRNQAFLVTTSTKLLALEAARRHGGAALEALLADPVQLFSPAPAPRAEAVAAIDAQRTRSPGAWVLLDVCDVDVDAAADTWTADCAEASGEDGKVAFDLTRLLWNGTAGKVVSATVKRTVRGLSAP